MSEQPTKNPAESVSDSKSRARAAFSTLAGFVNAARSAAEQSDASPNAWYAPAERYLEEHPDACREVYRQLWAEYVRQELAAGRGFKSIRMADKNPGPDCPSDPLFSIVNKVVTRLEGGSNVRFVEKILEDCESGELDCK